MARKVKEKGSPCARINGCLRAIIKVGKNLLSLYPAWMSPANVVLKKVATKRKTGNIDSLARPRVSCPTHLAWFDNKDSETSEFDSFSALEGILQRVEH